MSTPRSSSPLNPHASSSSPITSPTLRLTARSSFYSSSSSMNKPGSSSNLFPTRASTVSTPRYGLQRSKRYSSPSSPSSKDLFSEATTPTETMLWRERFTRRAEERDRRQQARNSQLDSKRGIQSQRMTPEEEEEADRIAQHDDEEIFRRLVISQRNKALRAAMLSHETEVGDPANEPEQRFWDEESRGQASPDMAYRQTGHPDQDGWNDDDEEEQWAKEAAEAEQAEATIAMAFEDGAGAQDATVPGEMDIGMDVDWEAFDSMEIE
ncbi:hypothetical protein IAU60_001662 [Kwoniella sp. DSM 27419]